MNDIMEMVRAEPLVPLSDEKQAIFDTLGDLGAIKVPLNRILLAIYLPPERTKGGIIRPGIVRQEDEYQGVSALVVKLGPHCYEQSANMDYEWSEGDICEVGDWVMFRRGDGFRVDVNGVKCMLMDSERGIKLVLPRPDAVF